MLQDYAGRTDPHGNELAVTAPAVADELAAAADLVKRKLDRRPAAVVRGLAGLVLPPGSHGPGAVALVRDEAQDMFGLGAREAVLGALHADDAARLRLALPAARAGRAAVALLGRRDHASVRRSRDGARDRATGRDRAAAGRRRRAAADRRVRARLAAEPHRRRTRSAATGRCSGSVRALRRLRRTAHPPSHTSRRPPTHGQEQQGQRTAVRSSSRCAATSSEPSGAARS